MTIYCTQDEYDAVEAEYAEQSAQHDPPSMTPPEYRGLYGEVVGNDCYGLHDLAFSPATIIDIGANLGIFTRFARTQFPDAHIIAIEPDEINFRNCLALTENHDNITFLKKALGIGPIWKSSHSPNGAHVVYLSDTPRHSKRWLAASHGRYAPCDTEAIMLDALELEEGKTFIKIDCEGAEDVILEHAPSIAILRHTEAFAIELHGYSAASGSALMRRLFCATHECSPSVHSVFKARKR